MGQLTISFSVATQDGQHPPTKGSARGFVVAGRAVITNDNAKNEGWAEIVGWTARSHRAPDSPWTGPLQLTLIFRMRRPKRMPKGRYLPTTKPDLDKMIRSVKDAMTGILYVDDSQICAIAASKEYAEEPGVYIELTKGAYDETAEKKPGRREVEGGGRKRRGADGAGRG